MAFNVLTHLHLLFLPLKVVQAKGLQQQMFPHSGGFVHQEHQQQRDQESRNLLEEPGRSCRYFSAWTRGRHVSSVGALSLPVKHQVGQAYQDEAVAEPADRALVAVHLVLWLVSGADLLYLEHLHEADVRSVL